MATLYIIAYKLNNDHQYHILEKVINEKELDTVKFPDEYKIRKYDSMTLQRVAMLLLEDGPMSDGGDPLGKPLIQRLFPEHAETSK